MTYYVLVLTDQAMSESVTLFTEVKVGAGIGGNQSQSRYYDIIHRLRVVDCTS